MTVKEMERKARMNADKKTDTIEITKWYQIQITSAQCSTFT